MNQHDEIRSIWYTMAIVGYILDNLVQKILRSIMTRLVWKLLEDEIGVGNTLLYILLAGFHGTCCGIDFKQTILQPQFQ